MSDTTPWVDKYAPKTLDDMIMSDENRGIFSEIITTQKLSNFSLFGKPGIGKTTLAQVIVNSIGCEYIKQSCSIDGSIDMVKSAIKDFCDIVPREKYKVVILDEADQLSQQAQMALRNIIAESIDNCRFILTANYRDKVIDALTSRCPPINIEISQKDILVHCIKILKAEKVAFSKESLESFLKVVIVRKYPDIRAIIESLQMMSLSGTLKVIGADDSQISNDVVKFIYENIKDFPVNKMREYLITNEDKFSADYVTLAQNLFNAYENNAEAMAIIADALWRMSFQLDKEIQFTGMIISLKKTL